MLAWAGRKSFLFLLILFGCSDQKNVYTIKINRAVDIEQMPYIPELSGDSLFWNLTTDRNILPSLIDRIADTTRTKAPVLYFGGDYVIGDVCVTAISELIRDFRAIDLIESNQKVIDEKGYAVYWEYVRANYEHRKEFQRKVKVWYDKVKKDLIWVEDNNLYLTEDSENGVRKKIPAGGFYMLKK
jgi:hypothetical protein